MSDLIESIKEPNVTLKDILDAQSEYNAKVKAATKACIEMKKAGERVEELIFQMEELILKEGNNNDDKNINDNL